jgi:hypothetical protein
VCFDPAHLSLGGLDQHRRLPDPLAASLGKILPELFPAALFIIGFLSGSNSLQMSHDIVAVGDQTGSDTAFGDRRQELLGAAASDAEQRLQSRPVDPRLGAVSELAESLREAVQPEGLIGHGSLLRASA